MNLIIFAKNRFHLTEKLLFFTQRKNYPHLLVPVFGVYLIFYQVSPD